MDKKILVLYTSIGLGHKFIAMNMVYHLEKAGYTVKAFDVLQLQEGLLVNLGKKLHEIINKHFPFIWRWLYLSKWFTTLTLPLRVPLAGRNYGHIKSIVNEFRPDCVIATQTTASAAIAYMKRHGEFLGKFVIAFSDYHLHRYWLYKEADYYLPNIVEQQKEMEELAIPTDKISVCGITLQPAVPTDEAAIKERLGISTNEKIILLASGSLGIGFTAPDIRNYIIGLVEELPASKVVVVCGKNEAMRKQLEAMKIDRAIILGFYEPMGELYKISDVFLTKPGGLTMAEALRDGAKIVITHWLPGQEELNYKYLIERNLVVPKPDVLNASNLAKAAARAIQQGDLSETSESFAITQKNHEGEILLNAIISVLSKSETQA